MGSEMCIRDRDDMAVLMRCCIISHNMMVEDRDDYVREDGSMYECTNESSDTISTSFLSMWAGLRRDPGQAITVPSAGSLAALCAAQSHMDDVKEYAMTRKLVMEHLWPNWGDMD